MASERIEFRVHAEEHRVLKAEYPTPANNEAEEFARKHGLTVERARGVLYRSGGSRKAADEIAERERAMTKYG